jgi:hypothetical protein
MYLLTWPHWWFRAFKDRRNITNNIGVGWHDISLAARNKPIKLWKVLLPFNRLDSLQIQSFRARFDGEYGLELFFSIHWTLLMN